MTKQVVAAELFHETAISPPTPDPLNLSPEEHQIIELILAGFTNKDLARYFDLSESTIHRRTCRIFGKLGVTCRVELVLFALERQVSAGTSGTTERPLQTQASA